MNSFVRKRTFRIPVPSAGATVPKDFELPSDIDSIIGMAISSDRRDLAWARATFGLSISNRELVVEGEDCSEYMYGIEHPSRTWAFGELPMESQDRRMRTRFTDTEVPGRGFSPYTMKVILTYRTTK